MFSRKSLPVILFCVAVVACAGESLNLKVHYYPSFGKVQLEIADNLFRAPDGKPGLKTTYYNNPNVKGTPVVTEIQPTPGLDRDLISEQFGRRSSYSVRWQGTYGPVPRSGLYRLRIRPNDGVRAWIDGKKIINRWRPMRMRLLSQAVKLEKGQTVDFRIDFFNGRGGGNVRIGWSRVATDEDNSSDGPTSSAIFALVNEDDEAIRSKQLNYARGGDRLMVDIRDIPEGNYTVRVTPADGGEAATQPLTREKFLWEGNRLGIDDRVYPPFKPIKVDGDQVKVVLRKHTVGGIGLWKSVQARGNESDYRELLAAPMALVANGKPLKGNGGFVTSLDHEAVYEGQAVHPAVTVETKTTTEYDGCMKVELTLKPGEERGPLGSLTLDIPLKDSMVPLWHLCTMGLRGNPAGYTPEGEGEVWRSRGQYGTGRQHGNASRRGNWEPYIWLGAEERGLSWFCDNDAGWVADYENNAPAMTLHRDGGGLTLRIHLVQKPITIDEPRTIVFGLMASPAKPMPENWRNILQEVMWKRGGSVGDYELFEWMGSQYWGAELIFAGKYPVNKDMTPLDLIYRMWRGEDVDLDAELDAWQARHQDNWPEKSQKDIDKVRNLIRNSALWAGRLPGDITVYWEEFIKASWTSQEVSTFGWEWTSGVRLTPNMTESFQNYATYYGAEFLRRGIGLYFDNTFPEPAFDPVTSTAYRQPDGHVQPSAGIWARREYLQRIWKMHRNLPPEGANPKMMLHMTNTHILPYMVWADANLDLEWRINRLPRQRAFSPELLRAESIGLQTGNLPMALPNPRDELSQFGIGMVHEMRSRYIHPRARVMLEEMLKFGYGRGAKVVNYWDENAPFTASDDQCKWLLMIHEGEALVLLCTWNPEDTDVTFTLDEQAAGVDVAEVVNVESGKTFQSVNGVFDVNVPGYGIQLLRLKSAE